MYSVFTKKIGNKTDKAIASNEGHEAILVREGYTPVGNPCTTLEEAMAIPVAGDYGLVEDNFTTGDQEVPANEGTHKNVKSK